jgi:DNA mismatch endonuclease (patch repair protein)
MPKSRVEFWKGKFEGNVARDERVERELAEMGWKVRVIWECETRKQDDLERRLIAALRPGT